jgi:hypothetical protein
VFWEDTKEYNTYIGGIRLGFTRNIDASYSRLPVERAGMVRFGRSVRPATLEVVFQGVVQGGV